MEGSFVINSSLFGRNSVEIRSDPGRNLIDILSEYRNLVEILSKCGRNLVGIYKLCRNLPNFGRTSNEIWLKKHNQNDEGTFHENPHNVHQPDTTILLQARVQLRAPPCALSPICSARLRNACFRPGARSFGIYDWSKLSDTFRVLTDWYARSPHGKTPSMWPTKLWPRRRGIVITTHSASLTTQRQAQSFQPWRKV